MYSFLFSSGDLLNALVTLLNKGKFDTLLLGEGDLSVFAGTDSEDV